MKIDEGTLGQIVDTEFMAAKSGYTHVFEEREKAVRFYYGDTSKYIPERLKRSRAHTYNVRDAVHNMLPIVMDMYLQTDSPIEFLPSSSDDIDQAREETDYANWIFFQRNSGKTILYNWFHDAFLQKNGYVKVFIDEYVDEEQETYEGYTQQQLQALASDDEIEIDEVTAMDDGTYNLKATRKSEQRDIKIVNVAPERVVVSLLHNEVSLRNCDYCCHFEPRLKSDLVVDGYDVETVKSLPVENTTQIELAYATTRTEQQEERYNSAQGDWTRDIVTIYEHYIRCDRNGDGKAELLQVITAGRGPGKILKVSEIDYVPLEAATALIIPNTHYGMGIGDLTVDKQEITTGIVRGVLDNVSLVNNQQKYVNKNAVQNPQQILNSELGGLIVGTTPPGDAITAITTPFVALDTIQVLKVMDDMESMSTGLNEQTVGLDAQSLSGATNLVGAMTLNQSQMKGRMIAMMLAEGVRGVFERIRELGMKYHSKDMVIRTAKGFKPVNPRTWRTKRETRVNVGLGVIQKQARMAVLQNITQLQQTIVGVQGGAQGPLVTLPNIYNTLCEIAAEAGDINGGRYFSDPANPQNQPPEKQDAMDNAVEVAGADVAIKAQKYASDAQLKALELQQNHTEKMLDLQLRARELTIKERQLGIQHVETGASILKMAHDADMQQQSMNKPEQEKEAA